MKTGFIQIPILIAILIGITILAGGSYYIGKHAANKDTQVISHFTPLNIAASSTTTLEISNSDSTNTPEIAGITLAQPIINKQSASNIKTKVPSSSSVNSKVVAEVDFHDDVVNLYKEKIAFLQKKIALQSVFVSAHLYRISEKNDDINFFTDNLKTAGDAYSANLINITNSAIAFYQYEIVQFNKMIEADNNKLLAWKNIQSKLNIDFATASSQNFTSEAEYGLRKNELDTLVNEDNFGIEYAAQDAAFSSIGQYMNDTDDKYHSLMLTAATKEKADADRDLAAINAEIASIKSTPVYNVSAIVTPAQLQPSSISCETTHGVYGNPSTTCIESPSMKSMTCDTSYNVYGNATKNCYFQ